MEGGRDIIDKYNGQQQIPKQKLSKTKVKAYKHLQRNINKKPRKKKQPFLRKKKFAKKTFPISFPISWKLSAWLFIVSMFVIIIIPTLIVFPYVKENNHQAIQEEQTNEFTHEADPLALTVSVMRESTNEIEDMPLEKYVTHVLASEMPVEFEMEALKAQSLAARTYIVNYLLLNQDDSNTNISDTTIHQVYKNEEELQEQWGAKYYPNMQKLTEAVESTKGEIITYNQQPITAAYFSTSNGYTENSEDYWENEIPYLRSVASPWDEDSPMFLDQQIFTIEEVETALDVTLPKQSAIPIEIARTSSNRVKQIKIADQVFSGRDVREKLALKSNDFTIKQNHDHLIFTTKGYGHGVGMSQYGANGMAKEGKTYDEIVEHYYQNIEISTVEEVAPTLVSN